MKKLFAIGLLVFAVSVQTIVPRESGDDEILTPKAQKQWEKDVAKAVKENAKRDAKEEKAKAKQDKAKEKAESPEGKAKAAKAREKDLNKSPKKVAAEVVTTEDVASRSGGTDAIMVGVNEQQLKDSLESQLEKAKTPEKAEKIAEKFTTAFDKHFSKFEKGTDRTVIGVDPVLKEIKKIISEQLEAKVSALKAAEAPEGSSLLGSLLDGPTKDQDAEEEAKAALETDAQDVGATADVSGAVTDAQASEEGNAITIETHKAAPPVHSEVTIKVTDHDADHQGDSAGETFGFGNEHMSDGERQKVEEEDAAKEKAAREAEEGG
jgi:hypothetical protein